MRGRLLCLAMAAVAAHAGVARAARVLVMGRDGRVGVRDDPFLPAAPPPPAPSAVRASATVAAGSWAGGARAQRSRGSTASTRGGATVLGTLAGLYRAHLIAAATYRSDRTAFTRALAAVRRLRGTRASELEAVIVNLHRMAVAGTLTPSRLPALFLTLDENRRWWTTAPLPGPGEEIEFSGSQLVWEYYPGQGLELQPLATFGRADGMYTAGPSEYPQMQQLLAEMIPLAARRAGGLAWEYYFQFDGGSPPWVSAMAQGTALEALTRAYLATGQPSYLQIAARALPLFGAAPPVGVRVPTQLGARYLQYSFAPGTDIINAFLQALIGLHDFAQASGDGEAQRLFAAGNADAEVEVPHFDTGSWSLYQPGVEDDLSYHELVTGFLQQLCARTAAPVYCTEAERFTSYLETPPQLELLTARAAAHVPVRLRFRLSKPGRVGVVVRRGARTLLATSAPCFSEICSFSLPPLPPGRCTVRLSATDVTGNFSRITATLRVSRSARRATVSPPGPQRRASPPSRPRTRSMR